MIQYQELVAGFVNSEGWAFPNAAGNRHYRQMLEEVAANEAEILPYVPPIPQVAPPTLLELLEARVTVLEAL